MNIYEIAKLAGVSIATVSRVVNDSPLVSETTKRHVRQVMEEQHYVPNVFARGLGLNSMRTVGLVCPDVADRYMARAVAFLERNLREYGYGCILCCSGYAYATQQSAVKTILQKRIDALVIIGSGYGRDDPDSPEMDYIREAAKQTPVFLLNAYIRGKNIYCALCNDYEISRYTVERLIVSGRRDILFLCDSHSFSANQKLRGYETALTQAGLPIREELKFYTRNQINEVRDVLFAHKDIVFDAVFAVEDGMAIGALKYAKKRGLSIPGDVNIIGYNNSELSVCCEPELSSIDSQGECLCKTIIDSMMQCFENKEIPDKIYAKGVLIERSTTNLAT